MGKFPVGELLKNIDSPKDLRLLSEEQLPQLAKEVRQYMIDVLSEIGNSHFAASLGVVEITVALHYIFNTPYDQLIWDVGHQAYGHKILTGRRDVFPSNRTKGGISGFPSRNESEYDTFGVGHSSTSISAALGMAIASRYKGEKDKHHIAVIGDGAMTAGLAFEGMNHAGFEKDMNLLVVLNDNNMSIDPDVGALRNYLNDITASYVENNIFEALDFQYFGPIDGHNIDLLVRTLNKLKSISGPKILHCITKKGKGYQPAEIGNPAQWHAPGAFNKETGEIVKQIHNTPQAPKYQDVFGNTLLELAEKNDKIMGITPAMPSGSSLNIMMKAMPERAFDVGIAEQHAVTFSAGLATQGMIPYCVIYSTFLQRAYDQLIHDVAIQNLQVVFCIDRAGLVGADGATHHGAYDISYLRTVPNLIVSSPMNEAELRNLMFTAQAENHGPFAIRYPRGKGVMPEWKTTMKTVEIGKGRKLSHGTDIAILSIGHVGNVVQNVVQSLENKCSIAHYDLRFVKPIDEVLLREVFTQFDKIITVEDGALMGGMGSAVLEFMSDNNYHSKVKRLGIPDAFIHHGTQVELQAECGYDVNGIETAILSFMQEY
ncbi:MAG TPA: 1-deoxy-D-xylulose-5-phosphate synthase [Brumimicrobium sp.]|nr:1-deoxy-D-xylulose-5-phosphate synthase [Brumimicrobium sp.]